jgi:hypothetical protein
MCRPRHSRRPGATRVGAPGTIAAASSKNETLARVQCAQERWGQAEHADTSRSRFGIAAPARPTALRRRPAEDRRPTRAASGSGARSIAATARGSGAPSPANRAEVPVQPRGQRAGGECLGRRKGVIRFVSWPKWRNGRRSGFKIRRPYGREGSSPSFGTLTRRRARAPNGPRPDRERARAVTARRFSAPPDRASVPSNARSRSDGAQFAARCTPSRLVK